MEKPGRSLDDGQGQGSDKPRVTGRPRTQALARSRSAGWRRVGEGSAGDGETMDRTEGQREFWLHTQERHRVFRAFRAVQVRPGPLRDARITQGRPPPLSLRDREDMG